MNDVLSTAANDISLFLQRLYRQKLTTSLGGNISVRVNNQILITPSQLDKDSVIVNDIIIMDMDGNYTKTPHKPSMETQMHYSIYKNRNDIDAIIHAHPFWGTLLAISNLTLQNDITDESYLMLNKIAYTEYQTMGSPELAKEVGNKIQRADILILKNHGVVSVAHNLTQALERIEVLENLVHYAFLANPSIQLQSLSTKAKNNIDSLFR